MFIGSFASRDYRVFHTTRITTLRYYCKTSNVRSRIKPLILLKCRNFSVQFRQGPPHQLICTVQRATISTYSAGAIIPRRVVQCSVYTHFFYFIRNSNFFPGCQFLNFSRFWAWKFLNQFLKFVIPVLRCVDLKVIDSRLVWVSSLLGFI